VSHHNPRSPQELGDTTTLAEPEVVHELIANHVLNK
jgi:hypothetical protein